MPLEPPTDLRARNLMSKPVVSIAPGASLREAMESMRRHDVQHLVVPGGGEPVGLVTDRDIRLQLPSRSLSSEEEQAVLPEALLVESVCIRHPLTVEPEASLRSVAAALLRHRVGSAIVVEGGAPIGIITKTSFVELYARS